MVEVINIEDAGFYKDEYTSGNCVKVTLQRGAETVTCDQILIWDEEYAEDCFEEWGTVRLQVKKDTLTQRRVINSTG